MDTKKAYFAGGCFWGLEELMRDVPGVIDITVGYMGGENEHPTYENHPGHAEALEVVYDPSVTTYERLLDRFFSIHNPTTLNRQGNDIGSSYRSAIFYQDEDERSAAESFIRRVDASGKWPDPVVTVLEPFSAFWSAEDYHQDYLRKNPHGYTCHVVYTDGYMDAGA
jgi:peptide-methionine (S)-S-oxide reductase